MIDIGNFPLHELWVIIVISLGVIFFTRVVYFDPEEARVKVVKYLCDAVLPAIDDLQEELVIDALLAVAPGLHASLGDIVDTEKLRRFNQQYISKGAVQLNVHTKVYDAIHQFILPTDQWELKLLLWILSTSWGCFLLTGRLQPFQTLSLSSRVYVLGSFRDSSIPQLRAFYQLFKRLTCFIFFSYCEKGATNVSWEALGYDPFSTTNKPSRLIVDNSAHTPSVLCDSHDSPPSTASLNEELECDVVVVGSGSGGGLMAAELTKAGLKVIVLEKGAHYKEDTFRQWREAEALSSAFERGGLCSSADGNVIIMAGSTVGGGSTVNWSASFRTPAPVLKEWEQNRGLSVFAPGGDFERSLEDVRRIMRVNTRFSHRTPEECDGRKCSNYDEDSDAEFVFNNQNQMLWSGAEALGLKPEKVPRNAVDCVDCGHCCHGCPYGSKQSTLLLMKKQSRGLRVISHCHVTRVLLEQGNSATAGGSKPRAVGVEARIMTSLGVYKSGLPASSARTLRVHASVVVIAGGALNSPALLLRSGLKNPHTGRHLCLHPVVGVGGIMPDVKTGVSSGVSLGVVVRNKSQKNRFDASDDAVDAAVVDSPSAASGFGGCDALLEVASETPPIHPGLLAIVMPWRSGLSFKLCMLAMPHVACFIGISRDRSQPDNRITIDRHANFVVNYKVTRDDAVTLVDGVEKNLRLMYAAGATVLFPGYENIPWFVRRRVDGRLKTDKEFEEYISMVRSVGVQCNKTILISAHQMGSCRMSSDPRSGVVNQSGETWEAENLFIADASVFPTALGINPMITVQAIAHMISRRVIDRVKTKKSHPADSSGIIW